MNKNAELFYASETSPEGLEQFSAAFSSFAPYFESIAATVVAGRPHHAEILVPDRHENKNHIGTVHAIAMCNGLEMAMGLLAELTTPDNQRWIPRAMSVEYTAKAVGDVLCTADTDPSDWPEEKGDVPVRVEGRLEDGTVAIRGTITIYISLKK